MDASILGVFGRLLIPSLIFVVSSLYLGLEMAEESFVLLSSSNSASLGNFNVVGDDFEQDDDPWLKLGFG